MRVLLAVGILGMLVSCRPGNPDAPAESALPLNALLGSADVSGYARALSPRPLSFPRDHGSHPRYKTEWWYFTGNLTDERGNAFGFELTFFRFALAPGAGAAGSTWQTRDAWLGHFAVTDVAGETFHANERISRDGVGLAGISMDPYAIWIEDWSAVSASADVFPLRLRAAADDVAIELELRATTEPVANGEGGLDRKGPEPGNASYYYSLPQLAASGQVRIGETRHSVSGLAWMDREWSSNSLGDDLEGWDWMGLQLSDGSSLMVYRLRTATGETSPFSSGTFVTGGRRTALARDDVELTVRDHWTSPETHVRYPIAWHVSVPDERLDLEVRALIPNQELDLSVRYWEGAVGVSGRAGDRSVAGSGYLELTGY